MPAIPNTPPPTFHDAFLNAFLSNNEFQETQKHQVSGTFHQPYQNDTSGYDYSSSGYQLAHQGHNIYLHPHLKIPQGFRVVQASIDGTIAIIIRGTTIYRCELMSDGQTSCKIAAQGAMLSTSQSRGHPLDNRVFELESNRSYHGTANHYTPTMYVDGSGILPTAYSLPGYRYHQQESPTPQQPSWQEIEIQSQRDQHTRMERESSSHLDWRPAYSIQSPPGLNTGSYQQQLANLNETLQSLTTMLMDAERVLCFPKVLGQSGVEATVMKKQVILVKIEELSRKRQQIEEQFAYYNPGITARFSPESRYPGSSRTNTEIGNSGHEEFTYQNQYPSDTTPEARMLSPLAPAFIPKDQTTATKSLSNSETSCEGAITRMQSSSDFKHSQQDGSIELLKSPKTVVLTENKSTNPPPKNNFNPNRRSISHVFGSIPPDTTWARLPGETFEAFHTRYLKQRERVIGSRLASKLFIPSLSISPRKSMPELQRVHVTSRVSSMETIDETQKKVCI